MHADLVFGYARAKNCADTQKRNDTRDSTPERKTKDGLVDARS